MARNKSQQGFGGLAAWDKGKKSPQPRQLYNHVGEVIKAKSYPAGVAVTAYPPALRLVIKRVEAGIKGGNSEPNRKSLQARVYGYE